jgi:hypothetical protein
MTEHDKVSKDEVTGPDPRVQVVPHDEVKKTKAGARGVQAGGNAGAMGDPVSDQSRHNYQVSRETDMAQHAEDAASHSITQASQDADHKRHIAR